MAEYLRSQIPDSRINTAIKDPAGAVIDPAKTKSSDVRTLLKDFRDSMAFLEDTRPLTRTATQMITEVLKPGRPYLITGVAGGDVFVWAATAAKLDTRALRLSDPLVTGVYDRAAQTFTASIGTAASFAGLLGLPEDNDLLASKLAALLLLAGGTMTGDLFLAPASAGYETSPMRAVGYLEVVNLLLNSLAGWSWKQPVRVATQANAGLSGLGTIDGVALATNNRVLVRAQTVAAENGIYLAKSGAWVRASDADTWDELVSATVNVQSGTAGADKRYTCTADEGGTLNTTAVTWVETAAGSNYLNGAGLSLTGNVFALIYATLAEANTGTDTAKALNSSVLSQYVTARLTTRFTQRGAWVASASPAYAVNDVVTYGGTVYYATVANSDATFTLAKWQTFGAASVSIPAGTQVVATASMSWSPTADRATLPIYIPAAFSGGVIALSVDYTGLAHGSEIWLDIVSDCPTSVVVTLTAAGSGNTIVMLGASGGLTLNAAPKIGSAANTTYVGAKVSRYGAASGGVAVSKLIVSLPIPAFV